MSLLLLKKSGKRRNVPADSDNSSDADVVPLSGQEVTAPPADLDDRVPLGQEGEPGDAETPSPAQEWRAVMAQWEAKLATLAAAFDRFTVTK
ncbi:unnamed protein product [Lampetra fluviatilis]